MASELAYMIANTTLTSGRTFEKLVFNDKNPTRDPVTGEQLTPTPFHSTSQGFVGAAGRPLPTLNLDRVYIIAGPGTCSASESIINSLRGSYLRHRFFFDQRLNKTPPSALGFGYESSNDVGEGPPFLLAHSLPGRRGRRMQNPGDCRGAIIGDGLWFL